MENKKLNQCKIHKTPMQEIGWEKGYRVWSCPTCILENEENERKMIEKIIEVIEGQKGINYF